MKTDHIEKIGQSVIQHGKLNNRIYLMKYDPIDRNNIMGKLNLLARENGYTKIFAKIPASAQPFFVQNNFEQEAFIPTFFQNKEAVFFMSKFFDPTRKITPEAATQTLEKLLSESMETEQANLFPGFKLKEAELKDCEEMVQLYGQVFKSYPFPIMNAEYIQKTMSEGMVRYFTVRDQKKLIGLSSAEIDINNKNAEMTDFAVLPAYRGKKLAGILLNAMETEMKKLQFKTLYTIARLNSLGMNKTFLKQGYLYAGLLKNNTNISGKIENMCVYYKTL